MGKAKSAVKSQEETLKKALSFIERVALRCSERGFKLEEVFLVGSRARGDYLEDSDVDLVFIVRGIEKFNRLERLELIKDLLLPGVDVFIYTPQEWQSDDSIWIKELKKEAKVISIHNKY